MPTPRALATMVIDLSAPLEERPNFLGKIAKKIFTKRLHFYPNFWYEDIVETLEEEDDVMYWKNAPEKSGALKLDNRKFSRHPVEIPILYNFIENITTCGGETGNISEGGLSVYLKEVLLVGMRLKLEIFPPDFFGLKPIKAVTQIVWASAQQGEGWDEYLQHGLEFIEMDNRNSLKLRRLLRYIEG